MDINNKIVIQFGKTTISANTEKTITLPKALSNVLYCVQGTNISYFNSGRYSCSPCCKRTSKTQITLGNIEDTEVTFSFLVVGY